MLTKEMACRRTCVNAGMAIPAITAMIETVTRSSTSVNPRFTTFFTSNSIGPGEAWLRRTSCLRVKRILRPSESILADLKRIKMPKEELRIINFSQINLIHLHLIYFFNLTNYIMRCDISQAKNIRNNPYNWQ